LSLQICMVGCGNYALILTKNVDKVSIFCPVKCLTFCENTAFCYDLVKSLLYPLPFPPHTILGFKVK